MEEDMTIGELIRRAMEDNLSLEIDYFNNDYDYSTRTISNITKCMKFGLGLGYIDAYCHLRKEIRTFKISRIAHARIKPSERPIIPNYNYEFDRSKPIFPLFGEAF